MNVESLTQSRLSTEQLRYWLALHRLPGVGPATFYTILDYFDDIKEFFQLSNKALQEIGFSVSTIKAIPRLDWALIDKELSWAEQPQQIILTVQDPDYPALLRQISRPPPVLYIKGDSQCLSSPQLAIVGSRQPSPAGRENAHSFATALARLNITITSGLALGIDALAHDAVIQQNATTIAVVATGLDKVYPARHRALADKILQQGAIVSEFPLGTLPKPQHFPQRNRIISGLSQGVLVVEAAARSGSLITARCALEQGRDVFALPGSIHNPVSKGCHAILRQGAKLVENIEHILEDLPDLQTILTPCRTDQAQPSIAVAKKYDTLLKAMGYDKVSVDLLIVRTGLPPQLVASQLLELEIQGVVSAVPGGYMRLEHA